MLAGDCLDVSAAVPLDVQAVVVRRCLGLPGEATREAVASGHHDLTGPDAHGEQSAPWLAHARSARVAGDGDTEVGAWIDRFQPDLLLTGHVHDPPFKPTGNWADRRSGNWIFNVGRQIGPLPAHICIDLDAGTATWLSMMGEESLRLSDAAAPLRTLFGGRVAC